MKQRKVFPAITFLVVIALLAIDVYFPDFEITETHIHYVGLLLSTFGLGGVYLKAIEKGFEKYREFKDKSAKRAD